MKKLLLLGFIILLALMACKKAPEGLEDVSIVQTNDANMEYLANDRTGNMVGYDWDNNHVARVVCRDNAGRWLTMLFDANGIPERVISEDYIVVIDNVADGKADFGVIDLDTNEIGIFRDVDFDIDDLGKSWYASVADGLRAASVMLDTFSLVTAVIGVAPGPQSPLALALSGVSLILSLVTTVSADYFTDLEDSLDAFSIGAEAIGCVTSPTSPEGIFECTAMVIDIGQLAIGYIQDHQDYINTCGSILMAGYGDIQVNLVWNTTADIDLHVTDPNGDTIYWWEPTSPSGGFLDFDDMDGYGPENIYWSNDTAPSGDYLVEVEHWSGASPTSYVVTTIVGSNVHTYSGTITSDQLVDICTFSFDGKGGIVFKDGKGARINTNRTHTKESQL